MILGTIEGFTNSASIQWNLYVLSNTFIMHANTAPYFTTALPSNLEVPCNSETTISLPSIKDNEGDSVSVAVSTDSIVASLVSIKPDYSALVFSPSCRMNTTQDLTLKLVDYSNAYPMPK